MSGWRAHMWMLARSSDAHVVCVMKLYIAFHVLDTLRAWITTSTGLLYHRARLGDRRPDRECGDADGPVSGVRHGACGES